MQAEALRSSALAAGAVATLPLSRTAVVPAAAAVLRIRVDVKDVPFEEVGLVIQRAPDEAGLG